MFRMPVSIIKVFCLALIFSGLSTPSVLAAEPKRLAKNGDWIAFEMGEGDNRLCFMTSELTKAEGTIPAAARSDSMCRTAG